MTFRKEIIIGALAGLIALGGAAAYAAVLYLLVPALVRELWSKVSLMLGRQTTPCPIRMREVLPATNARKVSGALIWAYCVRQ